MDIPNDRSSHTIPTPRGGGIAIVFSWFLGLIWLYVNQSLEAPLFLALLSGIPLVIIGYLDDVYTLHPKIRFLVQSLATLLALWFLGGLGMVNYGFGSIMNSWVLTPIAFFAILWAINLFNFLDGIDGYAASECIVVCLGLFIFTGNVVTLLLVFSCMGFLILNWPSAKIFMGDVGSTLLGFNIAVFAIFFQNTMNFSIILVAILTGAFWFDATLTLFRRWRNHENLSEAHRKHAYQRLVQSGFSHQRVTLGLLGVNIVLFGMAYLAYLYSDLLLGMFFLSIVLLRFIIRYSDKRKAFK